MAMAFLDMSKDHRERTAIRTRRERILFRSMIALTVFAIGALIFATFNYFEAKTQTRLADSRRLASLVRFNSRLPQ